MCTPHEREGVCKYLLQMRALSSEQNKTAGLSWQISHCTGSAAFPSSTLSCFAASLLAPCTLKDTEGDIRSTCALAGLVNSSHRSRGPRLTLADSLSQYTSFMRLVISSKLSIIVNIV